LAAIKNNQGGLYRPKKGKTMKNKKDKKTTTTTTVEIPATATDSGKIDITLSLDRDSLVPSILSEIDRLNERLRALVDPDASIIADFLDCRWENRLKFFIDETIPQDLREELADVAVSRFSLLFLEDAFVLRSKGVNRIQVPKIEAIFPNEKKRRSKKTTVTGKLVQLADSPSGLKIEIVTSENAQFLPGMIYSLGSIWGIRSKYPANCRDARFEKDGCTAKASDVCQNSAMIGATVRI